MKRIFLYSLVVLVLIVSGCYGAGQAAPLTIAHACNADSICEVTGLNGRQIGLTDPITTKGTSIQGGVFDGHRINLKQGIYVSDYAGLSYMTGNLLYIDGTADVEYLEATRGLGIVLAKKVNVVEADGTSASLTGKALNLPYGVADVKSIHMRDAIGWQDSSYACFTPTGFLYSSPTPCN